MEGDHEREGREAPDPAHAAGRPQPPAGDGASALDRATAGWLRRGYSLRYRDPGLAQLVRRVQPDRTGLALTLIAIPLLATGLALLIRGLRRRAWHTVTLAETPDRHIVTHGLWTPYPPEP